MARKADPENCAYMIRIRLTDAAFKLHQARRTERLNWKQFTTAQRADIEAAWKRLYAVARGDEDPVFEECPP